MERNTKLRARCILTLTQSHWRAALLLLTSFLGCSGLVGPPQPPPSIIVTVSPASASVLLGERQSLAATVENTLNTGVSWSVNGIPGGNAAVGAIDTDGVYTAPQILPTPPAVSLTATSAADSSKSATATITVTSSFSLALAGPNFLNVRNTATYDATLTPAANSNPSLLISWSVAGTGCTAAACGTITPSGTYTAPSTPPSSGTVQIVATPQADPSKAASLSVSIRPLITVSISPSAATVALGATQAFQATVTGAQDATVTWFVNGVAGGNSTIGLLPNSQTDPDSTIYAAPQTMPVGGVVTVLAQSNANPSVSARVMVTLTATINVNVSPASAMAAVSETQTFDARVNNTPDQIVSWLVNGIAGGSPAIGQICAHGSNPCKPILAGSGGSVDYLAPDGVPSPNPVTVTATSRADPTQSASASVTILPHVVVNVQPGNASLAGMEQLRFSASVTGSENQQVIWTVAGAGCPNPGVCGSVDSTGLYTAPPGAPAPDQIDVVATSLEDETQSGTATVTITGGPAIFSLSPTSAYAATAGGFILLVSGNNFAASTPGPGSALLVGGTPHSTSCESGAKCLTSLSASDLASAGNLSVQLQNPDGSLSNVETFVVLAQGSGPNTIALTPSAPESDGNDIVVVELSTNGGSGAPSNVSLNIAAIGAYTLATSSCALGGNPVIVRRPANGIATADLCVFSVSALDPLFRYYVSGPPAPDITISNREPLGLGLLHLTLQIPATAAPGPRTLFVENPKGDQAAGTGAIEVQ